jgi:Cu(I)/Ag(I) efflux system membrane fusion protein
MNMNLTDIGRWHRRVVSALAALAVLVTQLVLVGCSEGDGKDATPAAAAASTEYYCPMHPHIVDDEPGQCPICGMDLAERDDGTEPSTRPRDGDDLEGAIVGVSPAALQAAGVATVRAQRMPLRREIRAAGSIEADETRVARIAARVAGRLETLHLDFTGQEVRRGAPIYSIYSPDLVTAQRELLLARDNLARAKAAGSTTYLASAESLLHASRDRLRLWGIDGEQIARLESTGDLQMALVVRSPVSGTVLEKLAVPGQYVTEGQDLYLLADLSRVWLQARVYEHEIAGVRLGQEATVTLEGVPGREFNGRVRFLDPIVDPTTRTARVRIELPNPQGELKPGMFAQADLAVDLGSRLVVPRGALLDTGTRQVVYVKTGDGSFAGREVRLGERAADLVEVVEGLAEGEEVVVEASFLIDSQSQLQTGASVQWGGASEVSSAEPSPVPRPTGGGERPPR